MKQGQRVINLFKGIKGSENKFYGREAVILSKDWEGNDYYAFYPNCALGWLPSEEEEEVLESLGIDEFGTIGFVFNEFCELVD